MSPALRPVSSAAPPQRPRPRVVVVGSGFAGLNAALALAGAPVDVTLVDRDNYHGFWPLLYQVATAGLGPDDIAHPVRAIFAGHQNVTVRLGIVTQVDVEQHRVELDHGEVLLYDYLVLAVGSSTSDFGIPGVREHAFPLKTLPEAVHLRNHILTAFEHADADRSAIPDGLLTIVLAGGGPTGVEMAGALSELIGTNLALDFRHLDVTAARVVLVEATDRLLGGFSERSQQEALSTLRNKGVEVLLGAPLAKVTADGVTLADGTDIAARTVVWTAGVRANPLASLLPGEKRRNGTVVVKPDLSLPGHPEVFVVGDVAAVVGGDDRALPQLAQVAIQGGRHAAGSILRHLAGRPTRAFRYRDHGIMATIGRQSAVAELPGGLKLRGTLGWFAWLAVHLVFLVGFRNRLVVLVNWAWNYVTWDRASRVILDD
ncbi:MAG TPA: NAD(P)/FAD-dependent oxidoreductase [Acidimicrobiales bacterium]|nr:NAD(P)/FAD-dependent oxidoreductase [Acidimicrobiales bacterium]